MLIPLPPTSLVPAYKISALFATPTLLDLEIAYIIKNLGKIVAATENEIYTYVYTYESHKFKYRLYFNPADELLIMKIVNLVNLLGFEKAYLLLIQNKKQAKE